VPGRYDAAEDAILCEAPIFDGLPGAQAKVSLSLNGSQFEPIEKDFKFDEPKGSKKK
jgi:hypothetical protein